MEYKKAHEYPTQALAIEDGETLILALAKRAVINYYSAEMFKREVDKIITATLAHLNSNELKDKTQRGLRLYAQMCYRREREMLMLHVGFFALLLKAREDGQRGATPAINRFKINLAADYRHSFGFAKALEKALPDTVYSRGIPLGKYHKEYMRDVERLTQELIESGAKEAYTTNVSLRNIAEMTTRYEYQLDMIDTKRREGKKLVYILAHANCSKRCEKYQVGGSLHPSGLYSLDGTSGTTAEGVKYRPLEFATDNPIDRYTTKAGITYQNGCLTGFNCRHKLGDYIPNVKPESIPSRVIKRQRAIEQRQREYEREIRRYKRAVVVSNNAEERERARAKARKLTDRYEAFSRDHNVAYYPERLKIFDEI